jgi:hypothetical protein
MLIEYANCNRAPKSDSNFEMGAPAVTHEAQINCIIQRLTNLLQDVSDDSK